ncbi:hypothetical protein, partial [Mycobacterium canetti]|uniref:hypothetical protein n=1 Tax=Mycobacterium canetti TaxID=78331 RepID=UPI001E430952
INREPSRRELRDGELKEHISRVHAANYGVYGARKVSAGRTRGCLLRSTPETSRRLRSQIRESPDSPGRFT